ncbi:MAG: hypothetical protein ABIZ70_09550 [Gemmatimonadales bacterium]
MKARTRDFVTRVVLTTVCVTAAFAWNDDMPTAETLASVVALWSVNAFAHEEWKRRRGSLSRATTFLLWSTICAWLVVALIDWGQSAGTLFYGVFGLVGYYLDELVGLIKPLFRKSR